MSIKEFKTATCTYHNFNGKNLNTVMHIHVLVYNYSLSS